MLSYKFTKMEFIKTTFTSKGVVDSRIGGRSENQDAYGFCDTPLGQAVVVCDGMGGMQGGSIASMIAVNTILKYISEASAEDNITEVLYNALVQANSNIIATGQENPDLYGMGTTVTAIILNQTCATIAFIGDSRIYQLRGKKKVFRTFDHSMVFEMVANGLLTEEQARLSAQSNIILKALGVTAEIAPEIYQLPYLKGDRFVLCSDGFWGAMPEKELLSIIGKRREKLAAIIEHTSNLVETIGHNKGGSHDNLTAAIIDVECNSLMKVKMSKTVKIILAILATLLTLSVALNIYFAVKSCDLCPTKVVEEVTTDGVDLTDKGTEAQPTSEETSDNQKEEKADNKEPNGEGEKNPEIIK